MVSCAGTTMVAESKGRDDGSMIACSELAEGLTMKNGILP